MRYPHVAALAAAAAAAGLAPAAALATTTGTIGQIAFRRYLGPDRTKGAIFVAAPDGSGERQLTTPPANTSDDYPDVASDGSFVAFQRCGRSCHLYTVRTNGTVLRMIGAASVDRS
jgi:TolB protein